MAKRSRKAPPRCIVIAGPNGAGKTTFAREFLPKDAGIVHFVNADLIASGISPLRPELAAIAAGKLYLHELDRLAHARASFAFESTLSGLTYVARLKRWRSLGYRVEIVYLRLRSVRLTADRGARAAGRTSGRARGCRAPLRSEPRALRAHLPAAGRSLVRVR
jgi:predicted ABC-type ATPase